MPVIELNGREWRGALDFYEPLLSALGAPGWHGRNINALIDSMITGDINALDPPYRVVVTGIQEISEEAFDALIHAFSVIARRGNRMQVCSNEVSLEMN